MNEESYIKIAIELAKKGRGFVSPGALSGALLVKKEKIIGAGFTNNTDPFASEKSAIASSKENLSGAILYSNIESSPGGASVDDFVDELKKFNISKVVYGTTNPDSSVMGKVISKIKKAGIETKVGVLEKECSELNKFYFKSLAQKRPYITLKIAMTLDGKIADVKRDSKWITSVDSRCLVHELRAYHDVVLVGKNTILKDNPELTVRLVEGRNPQRVIIDPNLKIPIKSNLFNHNPGNVTIVTTQENLELKKKKSEKLLSRGVTLLKAPLKKNGDINFNSLSKKLFAQGITSILVEGGSYTFSKFVSEKLFDELLVFLSPKILGSGLCAVENIGITSIRKAMKLKINSVKQVGDDVLISLIR